MSYLKQTLRGTLAGLIVGTVLTGAYAALLLAGWWV